MTRTESVHEHEWRLTSVDFEDGQSVGSFECAGCPDVLFR